MYFIHTGPDSHDLGHVLNTTRSQSNNEGRPVATPFVQNKQNTKVRFHTFMQTAVLYLFGQSVSLQKLCIYLFMAK
jgi:hypothetical protein